MRRCAQCQVDYPDALDYCPEDGERLEGDAPPDLDPLIGSTVDGRYAVSAVLGEGGMGVVYAARHVIIDKRVAMKVLRTEAATDESASHRFLAEAKAASKIGQQNIVDITDFGVLKTGHAYFVMEFLDGPTLGMLLRSGPLAPKRALGIAIQIARGLGAAHGKGITHRDLKPDNVFVIEREGVMDNVKIVDFGIARDSATKKRLTVAGMVMGTPEYMAPEQASGQETDHRVDQYSLGCILYEMVTGQAPFRGDNPMQTLTKHVYEVVEPPSKRRPDLDIPGSVEVIIMRSLAKQRDDRYPTLDEMMRAMQAAEQALVAGPAPAARRPVPQTAVSTPTRAQPERIEEAPQARQRGVLFIGGGVVLAALVVVLAVLVVRPRGGAARPSAAPAGPIVAPLVTVPLVRATQPPPALPTTVRLQLSSIPPRAEVYLGDEHLGTTPFESTQPRRETPLVLVFKKGGYEDLTHPVAAGSDADVAVALVPKPTSGTHTEGKHATDGKRTPKGGDPGHRNGMSNKPPAGQPPAGKTTSPEERRPAGDLRNPFN